MPSSRTFDSPEAVRAAAARALRGEKGGKRPLKVLIAEHESTATEEDYAAADRLLASVKEELAAEEAARDHGG